jgi:exopolyphosphatase/guanosine-5'-triphosphate,3'-diphosphate pyrophosphatase
MTPKPKTAQQSDAAAVGAQSVAAIDIGANSVRMVIAEVSPDGEVEVLERLQRAVRTGQDTFRRGRLGGSTMRAAVAILRDYRRLLDLYAVQQVRAVATSAVREAANADAFLDRVLMATGLDVEVINTSEESRLTVSAVRQALGDAPQMNRKETLIADVGGGSSLLTILHGGEIAASQSLRLGSIRMQEALGVAGEPPERAAELLRQQIANTIAALAASLPLKTVQLFVAVGGDARFAAHEAGRLTRSADLHTVSRAQFDKLVGRCEGQPPEQLARRYALPFADAETLKPALLVYQELIRATHVRSMVVSHVSMRDGLLLDLVRSVTGQEDRALSEGVIHSATAIAEKYRVDLKHAGHVADLAARLFDEMQSEHGLPARCRLLLRVAGLLHETGGFVSSRAHHKHSYYLIANSEVFGLTRNEINTVAHIARYHRRSGPKPSHVEYMSLPRETRMTVSKLAALLRLADALDRGHAQQARDVWCERRQEDLIIYVPQASDLTLERHSLAAKADLFEDVYALRVRLEEAPGGAGAHRRAKAVE